jgi:hypothetical protein
VSFDAQRLYDLLPALHRTRDDREGGALRELLAVMAEQVAVLEENLDQLYDDQFIETCAEWVAPYIGGLIGYRSLYGVVPRVSSPRAEVAHTIAFRRRKGTASMLEQLARDVTGWNANVVEYFLRLGWTQYMNHIRPTHWYSPHLRDWEALEQIGSPFDDVAHTVNVRHIESGEGLYNIPNIGIFLWRLDAHPLTRSPAVMVDARRYLFSPLGNNTTLFTNPEPEVEISHLATPINVPARISRRVLDRDLKLKVQRYYGDQASLFVRRDGSDVPATAVVACDLSDAGGGAWAHRPQDKVAIDPVLGRLAFPENQPPPASVLVSYHYGFAHTMGGGEYDRLDTIAADLTPIPVGLGGAIQPALTAIIGDGAVEITANGRYREALAIALAAGQHVELRAQNGNRPTLDLTAEMTIAGDSGSEVSLNGLLITGGTLRVPATTATGSPNQLRRLRLRHCTLVPGLGLTIDGDPTQPGQPSLIVDPGQVEVEIDHCIIGGLRIDAGSNVVISDSIVDATSPTEVAYAAVDGNAAGGLLQAVNATIVGKVHTRLLEYASNVIFLARLAAGDPWPNAVRSERRQTGCVRFSFIDRAAAVPRRFRCQPELEIATRIADLERTGPPLSASRKAEIESDVVSWLVPRLTTLRYGDPGYGQLAVSCPRQIREGADDEAEMGAFHDLFAPQRETNLRVRLAEYLRFGLEAGIFYAT